MRYKLLGKSGLRVSELCLGTMTFGEDWGWGASYHESKAQFELFAQAGGNFIDTSTNYTDGTSERYVGEFIQRDREHFVVATKYTLTKPDSTRPNSGGNSRKNMIQTVERSLKRLQSDFIDILYLHVWDYMTPLEEVMRGLDDLVTQGKVAYIAISDTPAWVVSAANMLSELRGWSRFVGLQAPYSLVRRHLEQELLPMAKHWDMAVLAWGVLGGGVLTGKFLEGTDAPTRISKDRQFDERTVAIVKEVVAIAQEAGRTPTQVAVNWVRQQQQRALMIPILGARTVAQLQDNLAALEWTLDEGQMARLEAISREPRLFPLDFAPGNPYIFGQTYDKIDNHRNSNPLV